MCGVVNLGRESRAPGFQRNRYGFQLVPSSLPSTVISGRSVVIAANRPYELAMLRGLTWSLNSTSAPGTTFGQILSSISTVVNPTTIIPTAATAARRGTEHDPLPRYHSTRFRPRRWQGSAAESRGVAT